MAQDVALFWLVLAGLFLLDNLVLVPAGEDCLRFSGAGKLRYRAGRRMQALRRDLVVLNPLNPFDRVVLTQRCVGGLAPAQWRSSVRRVQLALGATNRLSLLGSAYLLLLGVLALCSVKLYFGTVLVALMVAHLGVWGLATWVLVRKRQTLQLSDTRTFGLALESLLVPGYLVNLGKRVWLRQSLPLAGFSVGLRQLKRMAEGGGQELYYVQMVQRLDDIAFELGLDESQTEPFGAEPDSVAGPASSLTTPSRHGLQAWLQEVRACLTTSALPTGS